MKFVTLEPEEFREFADKSPYKSFTQTPEIAQYRESNGWTAYYFGVEEATKLKAATMLIARPTFLGKSTFFAPGGPLLDLEDTATTNFFFKNLRNYLKSHNGYALQIDPNFQLVERDRAGEVVENGFNHQKALKNLQNLGFQRLTTDSTPRYQFILKLENRTSEQIFSEMKRNTRNHIRKAEKMGVTIRELKREELSIFKQITESTSHRRHFTDKPLSYYEQMYDLFHPRGEVIFLLAEASKEGVSDNVFSRNLSRFSSPETYIPDGPDRFAREAGGSAGAPAYDVEGEKVRSGKDMSDRTPSMMPLSAAMFILYGDEGIYLFSGSDEKYMKDYNAQYLIQWHMIKYAIEHGFKRYNFYGIQGLPDKSSPDYGIYDFKKGFTSDATGQVLELIGDYELPINPLFYHLHRLLSKLRHH